MGVTYLNEYWASQRIESGKPFPHGFIKDYILEVLRHQSATLKAILDTAREADGFLFAEATVHDNLVRMAASGIAQQLPGKVWQLVRHDLPADMSVREARAYEGLQVAMELVRPCENEARLAEFVVITEEELADKVISALRTGAGEGLDVAGAFIKRARECRT